MKIDKGNEESEQGAWSNLGGSGFQTPKWIFSWQKKPKNMLKINGNP